MPRHTRDLIGTGEVLDLLRERLQDLSDHDLQTIAVEAAQEVVIRDQEASYAREEAQMRAIRPTFVEGYRIDMLGADRGRFIQ